MIDNKSGFRHLNERKAQNWYTPPNVVDIMLDGIDIRNKTVLEPSAGVGHLVRECLSRGAKKVLWCEVKKELSSVCKLIPNGRMIRSDFLKVRNHHVNNIDIVIMNPPFTSDKFHILHAWDIAPPGCQIISLCKWLYDRMVEYDESMMEHQSIHTQMRMNELVKKYGSKREIGRCFANAPLPSDVNVGLIKLNKPWTNTNDHM